MSRLTIIGALLAIGALVSALAAQAQGPGKQARVGIVGLTPNNPGNREMFKQGLAQQGYVEGQRVTFVDRNADNVPARLQGVTEELVRLQPDILFARGPDAVFAIRRTGTKIPIVAVDLESDPVAAGFAKSLAHPGGNVTGVFMDLPEMTAKQLQLLREILPNLSRVAVLGDSFGNAAQFRAAERAARTLGIQLQGFEGRTLAELETAMESARAAGDKAIILFSSPLVFGNSARLATVALEKRLPTVSLFGAFPHAGGLLSYGPNIGEAFRRCGVYVAKVLAGAKAGDLPIERPERFELVINTKTAKALGLTMPPSLLARADQLID